MAVGLFSFDQPHTYVREKGKERRHSAKLQERGCWNPVKSPTDNQFFKSEESENEKFAVNKREEDPNKQNVPARRTELQRDEECCRVRRAAQAKFNLSAKKTSWRISGVKSAACARELARTGDPANRELELERKADAYRSTQERGA